jgi:hypothetical protein
MKPQIVMENWQGRHNDDPDHSRDRLLDAKTYRDLSTILVVPTRGTISSRVVQCWMNLMPPMNQRFMRMFVIGMEVGEAYNAAVENILAHPELSKWKYMITLEDDNMPPPDGMLNLYKGMDQFDVIGGLYWTKGEGGQPMIYGNPREFPKNFIPQVPMAEDGLQECNGLGMGFNIFKLDIFRKVPKPWFKTLQQYTPGQGASCYTQDLYFFQEAAKHGFRFACDTRIKVGHFDLDGDMVW